jgi:hypothetical protein
MQDLCKLVSAAEGMGEVFGLYPNENLFILGDWYRNHRAQKSPYFTVTPVSPAPPTYDIMDTSPPPLPA